MAKNKNNSTSAPKSPLPKSNLNSVELLNNFKPRRHPETQQVYVTVGVRDEAGAVVGKEDVFLDSDAGQGVVIAQLREMFGDAPVSKDDIKYANSLLKGEARRTQPQPPANLVESVKPPEVAQGKTSAGGRDDGQAKRSRPDFREFIRAINNEGVSPGLNNQGKACVEFPLDREDGFSVPWELSDRRVSSWLFRFYLDTYGLRPEPSEVRDAIEWLRAEAFRWGLGEPSGTAADDALDDDPVFTAVRHYCRDLVDRSRRSPQEPLPKLFDQPSKRPSVSTVKHLQHVLGES
jgi:hypothetical protein